MSSPSRTLVVLILSGLSLLSAFLLFQVQPLIRKFILPWFGGSPGVWSTCMLFFQVVLFLGYAYAHALSKLAGKTQVLVHGALLLGALVLLPIAPDELWKPSGAENPSGRILMLLLACVGLPYFVLSSTSPLVQVWFTRGGGGAGTWRLYALSNIGSLVALLSFPFFFEPRWDVLWLTKAWSVAFGGYVALSLLAMWLDRQNTASSNNEKADTDEEDQAPSFMRRVLWVALPALASVVLLATTNHVCQDVAVIPFMWVVPLSLYLLTFIICFEHERWYVRYPMLWAVPALFMVFMACTMELLQKPENGWTTFEKWMQEREVFIEKVTFTDWDFSSIDLDPNFAYELGWAFGAMFLACMLCHGELTRLKPNPRRLTSFYLHMSAGGALGGLLVSLCAPLVFKIHAEWPLGLIAVFIVAGAVCLRGLWNVGGKRALVFTCLLAVAVSLEVRGMMKDFLLKLDSLTQALSGFSQENRALFSNMAGISVLLLLGLLIFYFYKRDRIRKITSLGLLLLSIQVTIGVLLMTDLGFKHDVRLERVRNFYGTLAVTEWHEAGHPEHERELSNGGIIHGMQNLAPELRREPTSYYWSGTGIGKALDSLKLSNGARVGVVGMGAGTVACYGKSGDTYRFYDINPDVPRLAQKHFTYLPDLVARGAKLEIVVADARLALERDPPQNFDVLLLDAFSGDSVPAHLLTLEAFRIYKGHMKPDGIIAVHVTNSYLLLAPLIEKTAVEVGYKTLRISTVASFDGDDDATDYVLLTNNETFLAATPAAPPSDDELENEAKINPRVWTDKHHDLFQIMMVDAPEWYTKLRAYFHFGKD